MMCRAAGRVGATAGSTSAIVSASCGDAPSAVSASAASVPARAGVEAVWLVRTHPLGLRRLLSGQVPRASAVGGGCRILVGYVVWRPMAGGGRGEGLAPRSPVARQRGTQTEEGLFRGEAGRRDCRDGCHRCGTTGRVGLVPLKAGWWVLCPMALVRHSLSCQWFGQRSWIVASKDTNGGSFEPHGLGARGGVLGTRGGAERTLGKSGESHVTQFQHWKSRPGAWRLCSIVILLHVACFL